MKTNEIVDKFNKELKQKLIPEHDLPIECFSSEDPEIFNKPINEIQDEKNKQDLQ
jgi:hypothetical protein